MYPVGDLFGATALAAVAAAGAWWGPSWHLDAGKLVAFLFLVNLLLEPIAEMGEVIDQTQTAIAGWRKVLAVLELPMEVHDPAPADAVQLPSGPLSIDVDGLGFSYRDGVAVLHDVDLSIPAGAAVAVVGETGSGKTTFAKLLCRLIDPSLGTIRVGGQDLRSLNASTRNDGDPHGRPGRLPVRHDRRGERALRPARGHRCGGGRRVRGSRARLVGGAAA